MIADCVTKDAYAKEVEGLKADRMKLQHKIDGVHGDVVAVDKRMTKTKREVDVLASETASSGELRELKKQQDALQRDLSASKNGDGSKTDEGVAAQSDYIALEDDSKKDVDAWAMLKRLSTLETHMEDEMKERRQLEKHVEADYRGLNSVRWELTHSTGVLG